MPKIPGVQDKKIHITPSCLERPDDEVVMETVDHVEESIQALVDTYGPDDDITIHVAVTVER